MKLLLRYATLSTAYYVCCMLALTLFTYLSMRGTEHEVDPIRGTRTLSALCLLVCMGSAAKLYWVPGYKFYRPPNVIIFYVLYLVWIIAPTLLHDIEGDTLSDTVFVLIGMVMPVCTVLITYNYIMNHGENRWLRWFFCGMFIAYTIGFFHILTDLKSIGYVIQMIVSYFTLYTLPLIMLTSGKKTRILFIILTVIVLTVSVKRGGLVAMALGLAAFGATYLFSTRRVKAGAVVGSVIAFALFAVLFVFLGTLQESNVVQRFQDVENDEGSGRKTVWTRTAQMIAHSDAVSMVVGHGYDKVKQDSPLGLSAHNDFLEVAYDYGLVGLALYLCAGILLLRLVWLAIVRKSPDAPALAMFFTVYFSLSMISHIIIYPWANVILLTVSYICARDKLACKEQTE